MTTRERKPREKKRDDRDFDTTALHPGGQHEAILHRDYTAHFFRWNFAKRFIKKTDRVLEVGCGPDRPLFKLLFRNMMPYAMSYVGVDLNRLPESTHQHSQFFGEFDFIKRGAELPGFGQFHVMVCMEVVEHFHSRFMPAFVKRSFAALAPGGTLLLSTPVYDGKRQAANHINEMDVATLAKHLTKGGFKVERRFGTFMDVKAVKKALDADALQDLELTKACWQIHTELSKYYDNDALSCFFAPLFPDYARNNLWICRRPG